MSSTVRLSSCSAYQPAVSQHSLGPGTVPFCGASSALVHPCPLLQTCTGSCAGLAQGLASSTCDLWLVTCVARHNADHPSFPAWAPRSALLVGRVQPEVGQPCALARAAPRLTPPGAPRARLKLQLCHQAPLLATPVARLADLREGHTRRIYRAQETLRGGYRIAPFSI